MGTIGCQTITNYWAWDVFLSWSFRECECEANNTKVTIRKPSKTNRIQDFLFHPARTSRITLKSILLIEKSLMLPRRCLNSLEESQRLSRQSYEGYYKKTIQNQLRFWTSVKTLMFLEQLDPARGREHHDYVEHVMLPSSGVAVSAACMYCMSGVGDDIGSC